MEAVSRGVTSQRLQKLFCGGRRVRAAAAAAVATVRDAQETRRITAAVIYCIKALLKLYQGSIKALARLY